MKKIKNLFSTPKKAVITILAAVLALTVIGFGTAFTVSAVAESSSIGAENAQNFAFADANVDPVDAKVTETKFKFEQGQFVYDVEFTSDDIEYEYWVRASDGAIVKKSSENILTGEEGPVSSDRITVEQAKETALSDAGLKSGDVTYTKAKLDYDDGTSMYDIEFYTSTHKYEYEINAAENTVFSKSKETLKSASNNSQSSDKSNQATDNNKKDTNQSSDNTSQNSGQSTAYSQQSNNQAVNNQQNNNQTNNSQNNSQSNSASSYVSIDSAKNTALKNAGLSSSQVKFTKTKLDYDDGVAVYDIEFYTSSHEYEYEINAKTGKIISKDVDPVKNSSANNAGSNNSSSSSSSSGYIGIDKAKSIALNHAGLSASSVSFSKAKLESDDGIMVYEVEFYHNRMEYEYKINAVTGKVIEYDSEYDD